MTRSRLLLVALWHAVAVVAFLFLLSLAGCTADIALGWVALFLIGIPVAVFILALALDVMNGGRR